MKRPERKKMRIAEKRQIRIAENDVNEQGKEKY